MEFFGWGYWAYYPNTDKLIWSKKQCDIYGELCNGRLKVAGYAMFDKSLLNDEFREFSRHAVEMSKRSGRNFLQQFIIRHHVTQEIMFIESRGRWLFQKDGTPFCLYGFNRKMEFDNFQCKFDQLNLARIVSEWRREGKVPDSFLNYGTARK